MTIIVKFRSELIVSLSVFLSVLLSVFTRIFGHISTPSPLLVPGVVGKGEGGGASVKFNSYYFPHLLETGGCNDLPQGIKVIDDTINQLSNINFIRKYLKNEEIFCI